MFRLLSGFDGNRFAISKLQKKPQSLNRKQNEKVVIFHPPHQLNMIIENE